ncbi:MAG: hypothetical protein IT370_13190 [Deltaproteobacteria bacterium]|nr:hypothetical protein [Deltaproteobacteria bacterium]
MPKTQRQRDLSIAVVAGLILTVGIGVSLARSRARRRQASPAAPAAATKATAAVPAQPRASWVARSLRPVANPDPGAAEQPARARPYHVVVSPDGATAWVTLAGTEAQPGHEVVVIDVAARRERGRIEVGAQPYGLALRPGARWLVVTNRFSNWLSVVDTSSAREVARVAVPFYCEDLTFSADGRKAWVSNAWKDQVLLVDFEAAGPGGRLRDLGPSAADFAPAHAVLRASCGAAACHLYRSGGFVAGPEPAEALQSALVHAFPTQPEDSPLLRVGLSTRHGGFADAVTGHHHAGGVVFSEPAHDPALAVLRGWIAAARPGPGPGIEVGAKPRDLALSADGRWLYVANTASLDVSVIDTTTLREVRRIQVRSPVNDVLEVDGRLVLATLGVGSGHQKAHHPGRESLDRTNPEAEFTIMRDLTTGKALPIERQSPLGRFDDVDGTAMQRFRDMSNDLVLLSPEVDDVQAYRAEEGFTRWTSDSFEALPGDAKGDVPAELLRVVGAFPEQLARRDQHLYVSMAGSFEIQEWAIDLGAAPAQRLRPERVFATGLKPAGLAVAGATLVVADGLGETLSFIDLGTGARKELSLSLLPERYPANDFERGELVAETAVFTADQDISCVHCHYRDGSDGKKWTVASVMGQSREHDERAGGSRETPDLRALVLKVPLNLGGTLSMDEALGPFMEQNPLLAFTQDVIPAGDFTGVVATPGELPYYTRSAHSRWNAAGKPWPDSRVSLADAGKRRDLFMKRASQRWFGVEYDLRQIQRILGIWQGGEGRLLPNPEDPADAMIQRGKALFESPEVGCAGCHPGPTFTDRVHQHNQNKAFPPLITRGQRDAPHQTMGPDYVDHCEDFVRPWDPKDRGRVQEHAEFMVAESLRGLWARPPRFLHDGRAISLREVLAPPGHPALRPLLWPRAQAPRAGRELGMNERDGTPDSHGATSHLTVWELECLVRYVQSIE